MFPFSSWLEVVFSIQQKKMMGDEFKIYKTTLGKNRDGDVRKYINK